MCSPYISAPTPSVLRQRLHLPYVRNITVNFFKLYACVANCHLLCLSLIRSALSCFANHWYSILCSPSVCKCVVEGSELEVLLISILRYFNQCSLGTNFLFKDRLVCAPLVQKHLLLSMLKNVNFTQRYQSIYVLLQLQIFFFLVSIVIYIYILHPPIKCKKEPNKNFNFIKHY